MKVAAVISLIGAVSASVAPVQQPLGFPDVPTQKAIPVTKSKLDELKKAFKGLTAEAEKTWNDISLMFPDSFDASAFFSAPKPHTRKPDHEWDHVIKGADIQSVWVTNSKGEQERDIDGHLENYSLRTKKVDPSTLGVDTVKQYSGYLDDEEEDKHLFYCMNKTPVLRYQGSADNIHRVLRIKE
jgi:cathepsin A (carboxypeptidase C)